jgi:hypothetical protein
MRILAVCGMKLAADGQAGAIENDDKEIAQAIERIQRSKQK